MAAQDVYPGGPLNVSITNVDAITNTAIGTSSALVSDVFFYGGFASNTITFSNNPAINLLWESETGTATAPTYVPASNVLHVHLILTITGGVTNCFANCKLASYVPQVDPDAQNFFLAVSGAGGSLTPIEKEAVNRLVISMKMDGAWYSNDVIYPLVGGTTNSMSWNLKDTNTFRLAFHGTVTRSSFGFAGDGATGYADTGFKPASSGTNYSQHEASVTLYNHAGGIGRFYGSQDSGSLYTTLQSNSVVDVNWRLNGNADTTIGQTSGLAGFYCFVVDAGNVYGFTSNSSSNYPDETVAPPNQNMYLGARDAMGSADSFSTATISFFAIGGGLNSRMEPAMAADVLQFETILGR